jgi:hypothetical protein
VVFYRQRDAEARRLLEADGHPTVALHGDCRSTARA